jgi:exosortase
VGGTTTRRTGLFPLDDAIKQQLVPAVSLVLLWWLEIRMLWSEWDVDPQYSYGFLVPFLCAALFFQRWAERPAPIEPRHPLMALVLVAPMVFFLVGIQPFYEANPEWRVPVVIGAFCMVGATLALFYVIGGGAWVRHFLFPTAFFLIAVPWPRNAEEAIMGALMEKNAIAALEVLHWCGYEAVRRGHLIALPTGMVGVEEACSGVRSLQSGIMAALFFGEVFRFTVFVRVALVASAVGLALIGNFLRATFLSIIASNEGVAAIQEWHDTAGYAILVLTLGGIWLVAYGYSKIRSRKMEPPRPSGIAAPVTVARNVRFACLAVVLLGAVSLAGTEAWYRLHETDGGNTSAWTITAGSPGTKPVNVPDRTMRMLFFPEGFSEKFRDGHGLRWQFFYFRWPPGRTAIQALNIHDPRTCLGSIGMEFERQLPGTVIEAGGVRFPFRVFVFRDQGRPLLVFHSVIADKRMDNHASNLQYDPITEDYTTQGRWNIVKKGIRNRGQRLLEAAVWDTDNVEQATDTLTRFLEKIVHTSPVASLEK